MEIRGGTTRRRLLLEALGAALLVQLFYHPLWILGSIQSGGDSANLFWPIKIIVAESLWSEGVVPLWNPWSFMGAPLVASLQHAVFYPPDWLLYGLFPAHVALNLGNLLHLAIAGTGVWWWLRLVMRTGAAPAIILGAAFPCAAWFWGQQEHINQLAATAYLPWMAGLTWLLLAGRLGWMPFALAYSAIASVQFLAGHPQEAFYAHFLCLLLALGKLTVGPDRAAIGGRLLRAAGPAALLAGLLVAVQLLQTLEAQQHSRRQFREASYALTFSMPPDLLWTYIQPHRFGSFRDGYFLRGEEGEILRDPAGNPAWDRRAYGEYGLFVGVPVLLLALAGLFHLRRRWLGWGLLLIAVLALLLAMGGNTNPARLLAGEFTEFPEPGLSVHELFLRLFPIAEGFRVPSRVSILATFSLVTLAAFGLRWLLDAMPAGPLRKAAPVLIGAAVLVALYLPSRKEKFHHPASVAVPVELMDGARRERTLDRRHYRLTQHDDARLVAERHREATFGSGNPITARWAALQPHMNAPQGIPLVDGYEEGLVPTARFKDFLHAFNRNFRDFQPDGEFLSLLGVRYIAGELPVDPGLFPPAAPWLDVTPRHRNPGWRGAAYPRAWAAGAELASVDGPFWQGGDPLPGYQGERVPWGTLEEWPDKGPVLRTELPSLNRVRVGPAEGAEPLAGDALLALGWYPGWVAASGGGTPEEVEFLSAVHALLPAEAMAGPGQWELAFRPPSHRVGLFLSALGVMLWALGASATRRRSRPLSG